MESLVRRGRPPLRRHRLCHVLRRGAVRRRDRVSHAQVRREGHAGPFPSPREGQLRERVGMLRFEEEGSHSGCHGGVHALSAYVALWPSSHAAGRVPVCRRVRGGVGHALWRRGQNAPLHRNDPLPVRAFRRRGMPTHCCVCPVQERTRTSQGDARPHAFRREIEKRTKSSSMFLSNASNSSSKIFFQPRRVCVLAVP